ncbi:MAG: hypothetical protein M1838_002830 [Thelocarpon superellum]|nr:MAG: hypothetical protein M1838_002830 [Thelocarpon superellum]
MLREHINHQQVTTYLNIRNGVLRLWTRNPLVSVTREEAAGCARDYRWLQVAEVAHEWLVRRGYINFGCAEMVGSFHVKAPHPSPEHVSRRQTIVVIGAGMAGLGCARQLQGLFTQLAHRWVSRGEQVPRVVVLEGRNRVGGRIYSHPVHTQVPDQRHPTLRCTADMGAQIITGFEHGNPLNAVIRGQLGLHYHPLKDNSILHDSDGAVVDKDRDQWVEKLFNDILEHASRYRHKIPTLQTVEGDKDLIELGKDPTGEGGKRISVVEDAAATIPLVGTGSLSTRLGSDEPAVIGDDRIRNVPTRSTLPPQPPHSVTSPPFDLDASVKSSEPPTLGVIMDDAVKQCQGSLGLKAQDLRLLNWHFANLEYANAANVNDLSLEGWDQDIGNEFEGAHAVVIGGYLQVPRGLWQCPSPLDLRRHKVVARVTAVAHPTTGSSGMTVTCQDGEVFQADHVVSTLPLGVMKAQAVQFEPPLPSWKTGCIDRLGFGTLNKVVLIYEQAFWDEDRDMFGLLRDPTVDGSLDQADYAEKRGRFYLFWNCIKTSGCPMLVALMAGDAAYQTEAGADHEIICEATKVLATMFTGTLVPAPSEVIISRWCKDRFARGTYSYMGPRALPEDYDLMAKPVGNLHFAGEATCGTHPATVHGAYLSGLRAAHEVVGSLLGPIHVPTPLVAPKIQSESPSKMTGEKRKVADAAWQGAERMREAREKEVAMAVLERIGERPVQGERSTANPYLLYQKDNWHLCKDRCDEARRRATKNPVAKATRNEVRAALGQMWRDAPVEEKQPYLEHSSSNKQRNSVNDTHFKARLLEWDRKADEIRREHLARLSQQSDGSPSKKMRATVAPPDHLRPLREI